ncbi:hypothetical protein [Parapedobacter tibetensis]|nr:hypothetical protein [Parapedobacter tibetensis]
MNSCTDRVQFKLSLIVIANPSGGQERWSDREAAPKELFLSGMSMGLRG